VQTDSEQFKQALHHLVTNARQARVTRPYPPCVCHVILVQNPLRNPSYNFGMHIVLPGALPDADQARALDPHIERAAPSLQGWRARARVRITPAPTAQAGCTAYEQWQLRARGFVPEENQNLSAGLGCLLGPPLSDAPLWFAELVHIALASDGAALVPARRLHIRAQDSQALFDSVQGLFQDSGFAVQMHSATHWRVLPSEPLQMRCASPELVATSSLHDWWPQSTQARAWRSVFNAVQMRWFDHQVNQARAGDGLAPINGLWLFGGARAEQLPGARAEPVQVHENLYEPWLQQDWGAWLHALAELEKTVFAPLSRAPDLLVLIGHDAIAELRPARGLWRWF